MPTPLGKISAQWRLEIRLAGWAIGSIWAVIYLLLTIFVVYQALPASVVPGRNDPLIFNTIGWLIPVNFLLNASWLFVFMTNRKSGFIFAMFIIIAMLATALLIMYHQSFVSLTVIEFIGLRCGFSLYAGWLLAASILGVGHMTKSLGMRKENGWNEVRQTTIVIWIACGVYMACGFWFRNPLFGAVYMHVLNALRA